MKAQRTRPPRFIVNGGAALRGRVRVSGAKNEVLAAMCASLLTSEDVVLQNVPGISDVDSLSDLLQTVGATVTREPGGVMRLNGGGVSTLDAPTELITENRASFQVMGPLLARHGYAASAPPGGDVIGQRPLDVHLHGFESMGASVAREGERFVVRRCGDRLQGARIFMDYPSVSGTQNVLMAAVLADGESHIINAATEPEVQELCHLLNAMGARIEGIGTQVLRIEGVDDLHGATIRIMPDRIEAGTWAVAAVMSGGDITIEDAPVGVMDSVVEKLRATGGTVEQPEAGLLRATAEAGQLHAASFQALPYPGLATDLHAPMAALLTQANGVSIVHERVFDNRMLYVSELRKMGAEIVSTGSTAIVSGPTPLHGAHVRALDVRAGAAVLLAAIVASGQTVIDDIHHLDRGYDRLDEKLRSLGVELERI